MTVQVTALNSKTIKNITWLQSASIVTNLTSGVLGILVARYLGSHYFGLYSTAVVVSTLFALFADFGFSELMVREGSRARTKISSYLGSSLLTYSLLSIAFYVLMVCYASAYDDSEGVFSLVLIYGVGTFLTRGCQIWQGIFRIKQRLDLAAKLEMGAALLRAILVSVFLFLELGLVELVTIHTAVSILLFVAHAIIGSRFSWPSVSFSQVAERLFLALPFGLSAVLFSFYVQTNLFILSLMTPAETVGVYAAVQRLIILCHAFPIIVFNKTLLPRMYKTYKENPHELRRVYATSSKYMFGLGLLISFFILFYARTIVLGIFGPSYERGVLTLRILSLTVALRYLSSGAEATLTAIDRMGEKVMVQATVALLNVGLALILIPLFSVNGAALAAIISESLLLVLFLRKTDKYFSALSMNRDLQAGRFILPALILVGLATIANGRVSDYLAVPLLIVISPFVLRFTGFIGWEYEKGRVRFRDRTQQEGQLEKSKGEQ